mmetsp:Transcript_2198/g.5118  ORF Transcript_2198/g.5118 Transcript_2198/m.5118 type:complete len:210 (+) Transcript_2198:838-1467(+)
MTLHLSACRMWHSDSARRSSAWRSCACRPNILPSTEPAAYQQWTQSTESPQVETAGTLQCKIVQSVSPSFGTASDTAGRVLVGVVENHGGFLPSQQMSRDCRVCPDRRTNRSSATPVVWSTSLPVPAVLAGTSAPRSFWYVLRHTSTLEMVAVHVVVLSWKHSRCLSGLQGYLRPEASRQVHQIRHEVMKRSPSHARTYLPPNNFGALE